MATDSDEGKKAENLDFGVASVKRLSKTTARTKVGSRIDGGPLKAVVQPDLDGLLSELVLDLFGRRLSGQGGLLLTEVVLDRCLVGLLGGHLGLLLAAACCWAWNC